MIISRKKGDVMHREINLTCCVCKNTVITSAPETDNDDALIVESVNNYAAHVQQCIGEIIRTTDRRMNVVMSRLTVKAELGEDGLYHLPEKKEENDV